MGLSVEERLTRLRSALKKHQIDAYVIPTSDAHGSENPPTSDARRAYITGFTGSAGTAVVTQNEALLWTDGRYFTQAAKQLDPAHWTLMKMDTPGTLPISGWLRRNDSVKRVGFDPNVTAQDGYERIKKVLSDARPPKEYVPIHGGNLVDEIWDSDGRPAKPASHIYILPIQHAGVASVDKVKQIREKLRAEPADAVILSKLDDVAWLTNLRASDIPYSPVFLSYALITQSEAIVYIQAESADSDVRRHLHQNGFTIRGYTEVFEDARSLTTRKDISRIWLDVDANMRLFSAVIGADDECAAKNRLLVKLSPVQVPKAVKNETELEGMREAHIRDAMAECTYLAWLEFLSDDELFQYTEWTAAQRLDELRCCMPDSKGVSFNTISAVGANAAVVHYAAAEETAAAMARDIYLVDSGGHYLQGTTDITRTLHLGEEPTAEQKRMFTMVLKGHLALRRQRFPRGTRGTQLDCLARQFLWNYGLNYNHGTGHGVGSLLNVHEGPQRISLLRPGGSDEAELQPGMIVSNEPGFYLEGAFGIRIENLVYVRKETEPLSEQQAEEFYSFEDLTLVPYQKKLIDTTMLTPEEREQIDAYNKQCHDVLRPRLEDPSIPLPDKARTLDWLARAAEPLE